MKLLETRGSLHHLMDYSLVFNEQKQVSDAVGLLEGIPSIKLLLDIAVINLTLYLNDSGDAGQQTQNDIIKSFFLPGSPVFKKIIDAYKTIVEGGIWPTIFYRYSNLQFYGLVFTNFNELPMRETTIEEKENILKAYLIINEEVNSRIKIDEIEASNAFINNTIEEVLLPNFIYQNDYRSNVDFSNQYTRAVRFFEYLDNHDKYGMHMPAFYKDLKVTSACELIYRVSEFFTLIRNTGNGKMQPIIVTADDPTEPHNQLFMNISIDPVTFQYQKDDSFRQFRNKMFLYTPNKKFLILDISFLIDYLYKTHIFALSIFFKKEGLNNFLSDKASEFMEQAYFGEIMDRCFPLVKKHPGKDLLKKNSEELIDYVIVNNGRMLMIEFKDTILNSKSKNSGKRDIMFEALDIKFLEDEGPKGITQLKNAIKYLNASTENQAEFSFENIHTIYPIVVYTDNAFGFDGINKRFNEKLRALLIKENISSFQVQGVTFINLSFFEINEDYLKSNKLDIFKLIEHYHQHTRNPNFSTTPFEVFAAAYRKETIHEPIKSTSFFSEMIAATRSKFMKQMRHC